MGSSSKTCACRRSTALYEITRDSEITYSSSDGRYIIVGDMIDVDNDSNLSETRRRSIRSRMLETVPESEMLVFSPKEPKYTITVFTDIDCSYCRRLHSQMARIQPPRHPGALSVLSAQRSQHRFVAQGRSCLVLVESQ